MKKYLISALQILPPLQNLELRKNPGQQLQEVTSPTSFWNVKTFVYLKTQETQCVRRYSNGRYDILKLVKKNMQVSCFVQKR